jgi:hypothetical protein
MTDGAYLGKAMRLSYAAVAAPAGAIYCRCRSRGRRAIQDFTLKICVL